MDLPDLPASDRDRVMIPRNGKTMRGQLALPVGFLAEPPAGPRPEPLPVLRAPDDWMTRAACADKAAARLHWTADREDVDPAETEAMTAVCASCPVLMDCRRFLRPAGVTAGFWAGAHRDRNSTRRRVSVIRLPKAG
jgi:hypothetical protein